MELLKKSAIDTLKANERKREIDEGMKLASRVDKLRELASTEQTNLSKFRDTTMKAIRNEIDTEIAKKDALVRENTELREENARLKQVLEKTVEDITNLTTTT